MLFISSRDLAMTLLSTGMKRDFRAWLMLQARHREIVPQTVIFVVNNKIQPLAQISWTLGLSAKSRKFPGVYGSLEGNSRNMSFLNLWELNIIKMRDSG